VQRSSQIINTNIQFFYKPDALPEGNITFHGLIYPKLTWGLPTLSLTTNSLSGLPKKNFLLAACPQSQVSDYQTLCLRFNGHFPGEPGLAGVY